MALPLKSCPLLVKVMTFSLCFTAAKTLHHGNNLPRWMKVTHIQLTDACWMYLSTQFVYYDDRVSCSASQHNNHTSLIMASGARPLRRRLRGITGSVSPPFNRLWKGILCLQLWQLEKPELSMELLEEQNERLFNNKQNECEKGNSSNRLHCIVSLEVYLDSRLQPVVRFYCLLSLRYL